MAEYSEPDFLPWDGRRVPMTFVAGYLGSGKTTLINRVLRLADRPIAVLVNDVGAINIDAALIRRRHGDTIELTDGCVCCSLSEGFAAAIDALRRRPEPPDHVVVELSGVAEPGRMIPWSGSAGFRLDGVVTLVDVDQVGELLSEPVAATTISSQVRDADLLVLTKLDLVDNATRAAVEERLTRLAPVTPIMTAEASTAIPLEGDPVAVLLDLGGRRPGGVAAVPQPTLFDRHVTTTITLPDPVDPGELEAIIDGLPPTTVRAKGVARSHDGEALLVQVVGRRRSITALPTPELEQPTDLVVITLP